MVLLMPLRSRQNRTLIDRIPAMSAFELRRLANVLSSEWSQKGHLPEDKMPRWWGEQVAAVRDELHRRGTQLSLFP